LETIEELLKEPLGRYKYQLQAPVSAIREKACKERGEDVAQEVTEDMTLEDIDDALRAKAMLSHTKGGLLWRCPRCRKHKQFPSVKFCPKDGHMCNFNEEGERIKLELRRACDNPLCAYMLDPRLKEVTCPNCKVRQRPHSPSQRVPLPSPLYERRTPQAGRRQPAPRPSPQGGAQPSRSLSVASAFDQLPPPRYPQAEPRCIKEGEFYHGCVITKDKGERVYLEIKVRCYFYSTEEDPFRIENREELALPMNCILGEVYEIRGNGALRDEHLIG